jgi:hypothetical protein
MTENSLSTNFGQLEDSQNRTQPGKEVAMPLPMTAERQATYRKAIREAIRLAGILQGTMSLESQGLDRFEYRQVKRQMILRLLRDAE